MIPNNFLVPSFLPSNELPKYSQLCSKVLIVSFLIKYSSSLSIILEHSCEYFGSSFEGRKEGTKKLLGITHKSPIIIEESRKIIFFPTTSPEKEDCVWINLDKIDTYYKKDSKTSTIKFKNGDIIDLNLSIGSLNNQILRATRLKFVLDERIGTKEDNNY